jgi:hypothetical protein
MKLSAKERWLYCYLPTTILWSLPFVALVYLFGEGCDPNKALFSNDGPVGVMSSKWMQDCYYPGGPIWMDTYWLGQGEERKAISITPAIYWLCLHPVVFIPLLLVGTIACLVVIIKDIRLSATKEEKQWIPEVEPAPRNQLKWCKLFRWSLPWVLFRFAMVAFGPTPANLSAIESLLWLTYGSLGILTWFTLEEEQYRYEKNLVH